MSTRSTEERSARKSAAPVRLAGSMFRSPTTKAALFYALMGAGFSGAHLILAKVLPAIEYAAIALAVAILSLAQELAPLGAGGVILRRQLSPGARMLARVSMSCLLVGALITMAAGRIYGLDTSLQVLLFVTIVLGGLTHTAASVYQSRQEFGPAMFMNQSSNLFLLIAALGVALFRIRGLQFTFEVIAAGYVVMVLVGWGRLLRPAARVSGSSERYPWRESLAYVFVAGAVPVLMQAERLVIPPLLSLEELATFGVLAAIVMAPYRTLQMGATFTTIPRMRAASTVRQRRRLLAEEAVVMAALTAGGSLILAAVTPWVVDLIYQGKYVVTPGLIWATIALGAAKAYGGLAKGAAMALCTTRELGVLGVLIWLAVALALVGAAIGSAWGLSGLILGIAAGWFLHVAAYLTLAARHLRR